MRKLNAFEKEIERLSGKQVELESEFESVQVELFKVERVIQDLQIQKEIEGGAHIDKELARQEKEAEKYKDRLKTLETRISAIKQGKTRRLEKFRDEAHAEVVKEGEKLLDEYASKLHDLRQARAVIIDLLLQMNATRTQARQLVSKFENYSKHVDDKYVDMKNPIPLYNVKALSDNYAGEHAAILPNHAEMQHAIDGHAPQWFDYWKATGDILSPAEIAAKERKK
jgi:chromosome segregation ATPase